LWPQGTTWQELGSVSVRAETLGYDSIWSYDNFTALGGDPTLPVLDGWSVIAALAAMTTTARCATQCRGQDQCRLVSRSSSAEERNGRRCASSPGMPISNAFGTPDVVTHKLSVLRGHCATVGRDPAAIAVTLNAGVIVRDSQSAVQARLDEIGEVAGFPDCAASNQPFGTPDRGPPPP